MKTRCLQQLALCAAVGFLFVMAGATFSRAASFPPLVEQAFEAMAITPSNQWAYQVTTIDADGQRIERFDPSSPTPHWTLREVDGGAPDASDQEAYDKHLEDRETPNLPDEFIFAEMIDAGSLGLESEDDEQARYRFDLSVDDEDDEDVSKFLKGTLIVNKSPVYVAVVELENEEAFSPETGVKIIGMKIRIAFEPLSDGGPFFLSSVTEEVDARVLGFMKVAETETISVSDYVHVGD